MFARLPLPRLPRRPYSITELQMFARYIAYFALPVTSMLVAGLTLEGNMRLISWFGVMAMLPALAMLSAWPREPVAIWVGAQVRRREVERLEHLWASSPGSLP